MNHVDSDLTEPSAPLGGADAGVTHETTVAEKGSFSAARCSCGWFAPARRSRDRARKDADEHVG
ncbi:hypothetical protein ABIA33_000791 [Streptacidiphilus sp. MAP12-16]